MRAPLAGHWWRWDPARSRNQCAPALSCHELYCGLSLAPRWRVPEDSWSVVGRVCGVSYEPEAHAPKLKITRQGHVQQGWARRVCDIGATIAGAEIADVPFSVRKDENKHRGAWCNDNGAGHITALGTANIIGLTVGLKNAWMGSRLACS